MGDLDLSKGLDPEKAKIIGERFEKLGKDLGTVVDMGVKFVGVLADIAGYVDPIVKVSHVFDWIKEKTGLSVGIGGVMPDVSGAWSEAKQGLSVSTKAVAEAAADFYRMPVPSPSVSAAQLVANNSASSSATVHQTIQIHGDVNDPKVVAGAAERGARDGAALAARENLRYSFGMGE